MPTMEWRQVMLLRTPGLDLGSHVFRLSGSGTWTPQAGLSLTGMLEHDAQSTPALATSLSGICISYAQNRSRFQIKF